MLNTSLSDTKGLSCGYYCLIVLVLIGACRVNFKLKSDTNLFEVVKCKTTVSAIEVVNTLSHKILCFPLIFRTCYAQKAREI